MTRVGKGRLVSTEAGLVVEGQPNVHVTREGGWMATTRNRLVHQSHPMHSCFDWRGQH
jgi:hypothetical protein